MKNSRSFPAFVFLCWSLKKKIKKDRNLRSIRGQFYACERYKIKNYGSYKFIFHCFYPLDLLGSGSHSFITLHYERTVTKGLSLFPPKNNISPQNILLFFIDPLSVINRKLEKLSHFFLEQQTLTHKYIYLLPVALFTCSASSLTYFFVICDNIVTGNMEQKRIF